jgi:hypothetical protein
VTTDFDLLGDPIPEGWGKRGRPPHTPTDEKRNQVIMLQAFGWSLEKIAAALSISPPTLRKNYFRELKARLESRARVEARLITKLMAQVEAENVSAIDKAFKRLEKADLAALGEQVANRGKTDKAKPVGKKDQAQQAAKEVAGKYAPPAAPRLIN